MDPLTASYYRSILYHDGQDQRPLPPTLVLLHAWAFKRFQQMGAGSVISKQAALCVAMTWMSTTKEGRAFTHEFTNIGHLFVGKDDDDVFGDDDDDDSDETVRTAGVNVVNWDAVPAQSKVVVTMDNGATAGEFIGRRGSWVDVRIGGNTKPFRTSQVQLAGA